MTSIESESDRTDTPQPHEAELAALRGRVAELEQQLLELEAWTNRTLGAAQERLYWLDRWQIDLNGLMDRPAAGRVRAALRLARSVYRGFRKIKRRLLSA